MFDKVGDDILINDDESDGESDTSGEPEGLTGSSSENDTVAPGGHVKRIVKGIERLRRVRRATRPRPFVPICQDCEDEPPGLNPSSEEDCHDSDNDSVDDLFPEDTWGKLPGDSCTGNMRSNARNHRVSLRPSKIEETAMIINEHRESQRLQWCFYGFSFYSHRLYRV